MEKQRSPTVRPTSVYLFSPSKFVHKVKSSPVRHRRRFSLQSTASTKTPKIISFVKNPSFNGRKREYGDVSASPARLRRFSLQNKESEVTLARGLPLDSAQDTQSSATLPHNPLFRPPEPQRTRAKKVVFQNPWVVPEAETTSASPQKPLSDRPLRANNRLVFDQRQLPSTPARASSAPPAQRPISFAPASRSPLKKPNGTRTSSNPTSKSLFPAELPVTHAPKGTPRDQTPPRRAREPASPKGGVCIKSPANTANYAVLPETPLVVQRHEVGSSKGKTTVWFESCSPELLASPKVEGWLFPGDLYVHFYGKGRQSWVRDGKGDWVSAFDGGVHPMDPSRVLSIRPSGEPLWIERA